jgi:hypothetical protein
MAGTSFSLTDSNQIRGGFQQVCSALEASPPTPRLPQLEIGNGLGAIGAGPGAAPTFSAQDLNQAGQQDRAAEKEWSAAVAICNTSKLGM